MHTHSHELTLGLSFFLGAIHALEPGHGKTAMLVYLSDGRKSFWHPLVMGVSSALAHSVSLLVIALLVHLAQHVVTGDHEHHEESVTHAFQWISALLVLCVGGWMLWSAWNRKPTKCSCKQHRDQNCDSEPKMNASSYSMSALLGIAFGLLPCPSAIAAYFAGVSSGNAVAAYAVIGLFAAGIATSLTVIGMLLQVFGERWFGRPGRLQGLPWPFIRAGLILAIGAFYVSRLTLV